MKYDPLSDGISNVELIDSMGDDITVVNSARVSMDKVSDWEERVEKNIVTERWLSVADQRLIRYLAKHHHWTPFSHCTVTLRIKMPIFVARQWYKHQVGFTRNEVSRRYVDSSPQFFIPKVLRRKADHVKQGSSLDAIKDNEFVRAKLLEKYLEDSALYETMLASDVCPEQARIVLPQAMYTEFYETASLYGYHRLCQLRLDGHAQLEIQHYAEAVSKLMATKFPYSWKELENAYVNE